MAATPLIGAPLAMNAMAGPGAEQDVDASRRPPPAACGRRRRTRSTRSPARAWRRCPVRMPMSTGTNENASGTALPTRSFSAARAAAKTRRELPAQGQPREQRACASSVSCNPPVVRRSVLRQEMLRCTACSCRARRAASSSRRTSGQHRERLRLEAAVVGEHRHQLVVDAGGGRLVGAHDLLGDLDRLGLVARA